MKTIKEAKAKMTVGTRLLCVRNTYRPVLDGTERIITKSPGSTWKWRHVGDDRDSFSDWPSGIKIIDADTIRIPLGRPYEGKAHYVELRFLEVAPATPTAPKTSKASEPTEFRFPRSGEAFDKAKYMSRYAHRDWAVWKEGESEWYAAEVSAGAIEMAMSAVGESGKFSLVKGGTYFTVTPSLARIFISNLEAGHYAHG